MPDSGTIDASGGVLTLGAVSGSGGLQVEPGATLELGSGTLTTTFNFSGGSLLLDSASGYTGALSNFAPNDTLILKATQATGASVGGTGNGTSLSITVAGGTTLQYALVNTQANIGATVSIDPSGNADVVLTPPPAGACFLEGTRILTARGEVAVEQLRAGDRVVSLLGRRLAQVVWVGHSHIRGDRHPRPWDVHPVRVQADAFGPGAPHATLYLSPDHAVFQGGVLIPVRYLLNGASVVQVPRDAITYFHVELDRHDVLFAAGLACESYLDTGNRGAFEGQRPRMLHADFAREVWAAAGCAPLATAGAAVVATRRRLLAEALRLGHAVTADADLRVEAAGGVVLGRMDGAMGRFALPAGVGKVRLVSRRTAAADFDPESDDRRRVGVAVAGMALDGRAVGPERLGAGWHAAESGWRWTDGAGEVDCTGASELAVALVAMGRYWDHAACDAVRQDGRDSGFIGIS